MLTVLLTKCDNDAMSLAVPVTVFVQANSYSSTGGRCVTCLKDDDVPQFQIGIGIGYSFFVTICAIHRRENPISYKNFAALEEYQLKF